jgi:hypothetical protein
MIQILADPQNWPAWFLFFVSFVLILGNALVSRDD